MKKLIAIALLFSAPQCVTAQSPKTVLQKVMDVYQGNFTVSVQAVYRYHPDYDSRKVTDSMSSLIVMHGSNYYFRIGDVEMMRQDDYYIETDQAARQISVSKFGHLDAGGTTPGMLNTLLNDSNTKVIAFDAGKGLKGIRVYYSGSLVVQADFFIDENYYIRKCVLRYQEDIDWAHKKISYSKLEIIYAKPAIRYSPFPTREYGVERFIQAKGNNLIKTTSLYSKYQLTDHTR